MDRRERAERYLAERTGRFEYRSIRYAAVADELFARGLADDDLLCDVGAGMCDFDFYLRTVRGYKGRYWPIDASIDGVDLDVWRPTVRLPFVTMIETIEHVYRWVELVDALESASDVLVVTTPNTDRYGERWVRQMDYTHVVPVYRQQLENLGFEVTVHSFFGLEEDSLMGVLS